MSKTDLCDMSIAVTGSGGAGSITAGELLLSLAGKNGCFGMMRRSFGPQIRGGEAAALIRIGHRPIECMNDAFDILLALDWRNAERFAEEIALRPDSLIIADPAAGAVEDALQQALGEFFLSDQVHGWLQLPASAGRLRAAIYRTGEVLQDVPDDVGGWWLEVRIRARELEALCRGEDLDCVLRPDREPLRVAGAAQAP